MLLGTALKLSELDHGRSTPSRPFFALSDVLSDLAQLVSQIETLKISSIEELRQAFSLLDFASTCIRYVVTRHVPAATPRKHELLIQCDKIDQLIASARMQSSLLNEC